MLPIKRLSLREYSAFFNLFAYFVEKMSMFYCFLLKIWHKTSALAPKKLKSGSPAKVYNWCRVI